MEIIINAKQKGNKQFRFLDWDHPYHRYYKYVLRMIKDKKYTPKLDQAADDDSISSSDEDDDGTYLHPSLLAGGSINIPNGVSSPGTVMHDSHSTPNFTISEPPTRPSYKLGQENDMYSQLYNRLTAVFPTLAKQDSAPRDGTSTGANGEAMTPQNEEAAGSADSADKLVAAIIPPPPDVQPIVDRLAEYVARNGVEFENIVRLQQDPRFVFIEPDNPYYGYYQAKVRWYQYEDYMTKYYHGAGEWFGNEPAEPETITSSEEIKGLQTTVTMSCVENAQTQIKPVIDHPWCSAEVTKPAPTEDKKKQVTTNDLKPLDKPSSVSISFSIKPKEKQECASKLKPVSCALGDDSDDERQSSTLPLPEPLSPISVSLSTTSSAPAVVSPVNVSDDFKIAEDHIASSKITVASAEESSVEFNGTADAKHESSPTSSTVGNRSTPKENATDELIESFFTDTLENPNGKAVLKSLQSDRRIRARLFLCKLRKSEEDPGNDVKIAPSDIENDGDLSRNQGPKTEKPHRKPDKNYSPDLPLTYARHGSHKRKADSTKSSSSSVLSDQKPCPTAVPSVDQLLSSLFMSWKAVIEKVEDCNRPNSVM
ncbi:unnamed protein product [Soboliphyme baturini]|uniref:SURP motif domain-containing protein n=1 Tax=Soboliphyme baturini TaxID=241478 RepID=A0A183J3N7_9BILA|nr:unnamed protein product [Soboliphyme baturini]